MILARHTYVLLLASLLYSLFTQAQEQKSLLQNLEKQKEGSERVNTLLKLSNYYIYKRGEAKTDLDSAFIFTKQAETESKKINYAWANCRTLSLYARIYAERRDKDKTIYFADKALKTAIANNYQDICGEAYKELYAQCNYYDELTKKMELLGKAIAAFRQKSTKLQLADILTIAAEDYNYMGDADKSVAFLKEALSLYKAIGHKNMVNAYRVAGSLYASRADYKKSIDFLLKAVVASENKEYQDNELLTHIYNQLSANYHALNETALADTYIRKSFDYALKSGNTESVYTAANNIVSGLINKSNYKEAERFLKKIYAKHKPVTIADIITVQACFIRIYIKLKQFDKGEPYCRQMIALLDKQKAEMPKQIYTYANSSLCRFYLAKGDYATARKYLDANLNVLSDREFTAKKNAYILAYQLDSAQANLPRAIEYLKKLKTVDDSIFNLEKNKEISQLQISYESEKKDKDIQLKAKSISLLNKEKELQEHKIQQTGIQKNVALGGVAIALMAAFGIFLAYRNKNRLNTLLEQQKEEITDKNDTLNKLVDEKEWLLKEIHHRVKNNLQIVMSLLNTQSAYLTDESAKKAIGDSQRRMHSIALIHQQLYKSDNVSAIKMYRYISELVSYLQDTYDSSLVKFEINVDDIELDVAQTIPIGLILNEAVTNSFKYAFAPNEKGFIRISLCQLDGTVYELTISDNGKGVPEGFDPQDCDSLGMQLLSGLSSDLNGDFSIYNDGGTVIKIIFDTKGYL